MTDKDDDSVFVLTTANFRVSFPCQPQQTTSKRGGTKYVAQKDDCSVLFLCDRFETEAEAQREFAYDYKSQFGDDGYDDFGEDLSESITLSRDS